MFQDAIKTQNERKVEVVQYQVILTEIETWLQTMATPVENVDNLNQNEQNTIDRIDDNQDTIKKLKEREQSLINISSKLESLREHGDVSPLAKSLLEQLTITIHILREQIIMYTTRITILENHLQQLREQPTSIQSENTIDSSPMPEEVVALGKYVDEEQQTSFPLQKAVVDTLDTSAQTTKERKPTENIVVTQTISDGGHETIKFESVPNPIVTEVVEDVFVDAKYKQAGDPTRTSELVLRNVPQSSFETTFVEPDETTTEVIVDADGTKRIIVRKLTRTRQQVIQQHHHQQYTTISTTSGGDNVPVTQSITQVNVGSQKSATTFSGAGGTKTTLSKQTKGSYAAGTTPDNLVIHETYETEPEIEHFESPAENVTLQGITMHEGDIAYVDRSNITRIPTPEPLLTEPGYEQSSIRAVVQQVTRRIIRRTRKIIKRIVIIDGKEHITEEVVEEPEEIEITEEEIPQVNLNIVTSRDGQIITQEQYGEPIVEQIQIISSPEPVTFTKEVEIKTTTTPIVIEEIVLKQETVPDEPIKEQTQKSDQEQNQQPEHSKKEEDVQVLELVTAPVEIVDPAPSPSVNVTNIELAADVIQAPPKEEIVIEIVRTEPEITNITNIWPQEHHLKPLDIEISEKQVDSTTVEYSLKDKVVAQEIWPTDLNTGSPFELQQYEFEARTSPTEVQVPSEVPALPKEEPSRVEITVDSPATKSESIVHETIEIQPPVEATQPAAPQRRDEFQEAPKPTIDVRSATQLFIDNELNKSDATTRTIKVSLPSKGSQSPGSVTVTMKVEPTEQATVNVNIVEEALPGQTEYDDRSISDDSKRNRKKKKRKEKTPIPSPEEEQIPESLDPSVVESVELNVDDENTISEKMEMPEIVTTPEVAGDTGYEPEDKTTLEEGDEIEISSTDKTKKKKKKKKQKVKGNSEEGDDTLIPKTEDDSRDGDTSIESDDSKKVKTEKEAAISPDESCATISELEGSVKVIEESVISASESPKPIVTEVVITTGVVEAKCVEDAAQQTSPTQDTTEQIIVTEKPVVELRSAQTSPEAQPQVVHIFQQTTPEPEEKTKTEVTVTEVQTSPVPEEKQPIEVVSEEVQTDQTSEPKVETFVQTVEIQTKEQELQTTPRESPRREKTPEVVHSSDVVPHVTESVVSEIVREIPITIPTSNESTNTVQVTTIETITQTVAESPRDKDDTSVSTSTSEPYEIHIQASFTLPEDDGTSLEFEQPEPVVVEITKSFVIDESKPHEVQETSSTYQEVPATTSDKKKKNKKKNKKGKGDGNVEVNVSVDRKVPIDETKQFLEGEQYVHHAPPTVKTTTDQVISQTPVKQRPEPSAPPLETSDLEVVTEDIRIPDVTLNIEIVQQKTPASESKDFLDNEQYVKRPTPAPRTVETTEISEVVQTAVAPESTVTATTPEVVQLQITTSTEFSESVVEARPVQSTEAIITTSSVQKSAEPTPEASQQVIEAPSVSDTVTEVVETADNLTPSKPNLVQLSITKTTIYDNYNIIPGSPPDSTVEITTSEITQEEKQPIAPKKSKQKATSSVTIEEVLSPTEEIDAPLTPGMDRAEEYGRAPETIWSSNLIVNRPTTSSQDFISAESTVATQAPAVKQPAAALWLHANDAITDRIRNINNVRNAHLSNVLHLATLSEVVTEEPVEHRIQVVEENLDNLQRAIEIRDTVIIQKTVITIIETISTWLETIEYRVYLNRQNSSEGPSDDKVKEFNDLNNELANIEETVTKLTSNLNQAGDLVSSADKKRMGTCFDNLKEQIQAVETVTKENSEQASRDLKRWTEYITIVHKITIYITDLQKKFEYILNQEDTPIDTKLRQLDDLENENREQAREIAKVISTARALMRDFPSKQLPQDVYDTYEASRTLENAITLERSKLLHLLYLAEDYEQTLYAFEQITQLADSLVEQPINVKSLDELQQEMQKHRKFFINLSHCRALLESLEENLDPESRRKHSELHKTLYDRATAILEKASERAQKISLAASRWTVLERGMRDEHQWLQVAQQRVPDLSEATSADYDRYITLYQSLSSDISNHHAKILQLTGIAAKLQELVNAPNLEEENNDSLAILLKLREEVTLYLRRLYTFREIWSMYEIQTDKLELWIKEAERDLASIEVPKDLRTQPIENMRQFWEIKVHYEVNNGIRNDIANNLEKSVEVVPIADEVLQRQFHGQLENRWHNVSKKINDIQNAIVNSLSDQDLPINDKLALLERELKEIQLNIAPSKSVIKNEEELNLYIERMQVLSSRIGIICNELGKIGLLPSAEPEQIGELFALSHGISTQVAEELENASILRDRLIVIQQGIQRVQKNQQNSASVLDKCESQEKFGSEQIEMAIIDCQDVKEELVSQWQEIMRLRQLLHTLPMRLRVSVSPVKLERDLTQLQDEHAFLESRCANILGMLKSRLTLWRRFEKQLELVQQSVNETDYMVELLKVNGQVDYERLRKATERLEVSDFIFYHIFIKNDKFI